MPPRWGEHRLRRGADWLLRPIFWVVLLALALRLAYVFSDAPTPVQFDARIYVSTALALSLAAAHPSLLFDPAARERISYDLVYADLLKGESIEWLYYAPPTFEQALEWVYFSGPGYPALLGAVFWPPWGHDFAAARVLNALLDTITCALLFWILRRTAGHTVALLGAGLFAVYPGAIIKCGELNLESLASTLVVLAVALCVSAVLDARRGRFFLAGMVGGLLLLTKASLSLMIVFLGSAAVLVLWRQRAPWWGAAGRLAAGFALFAVPWVLLVGAHFGALGVRDPQYSAANFRSSNMLANRGYDLDYARDDFWTYPVAREIAAHPLSFVGLYLEKCYRLWNRSYNDYRVPLVFGVEAQLWFHRLLMLCAVVGLGYWSTRENRCTGLVALAALAYTSIMHSVWHSLTRYALPTIPLAIGAAAIGLVTISSRLGGSRFTRRLAIPAAAGLVTFLAWAEFDVGHVLAWLGALAPETAAYLVAGVRAVVLSGDLCLLARLLGPSRRVWVMCGTLLVVGQAILWERSLPRASWAEWSVVLNDPRQAVERVIQFPAEFNGEQYESIEFLADVQSGGGDKFVLQVMLDSTVYPLPGGSYAQSFYAKGSYTPFLQAYHMKREQLRQWMTLAIPREVAARLLADHKLRVRVWVTGGTEPGDLVRVFGDYRPRVWREWEGPTMAHSSVERLYEEGDPRIWENVPRELAGARNRWMDVGGVNEHDLSPAPGLQSGDYRLIIRCTTASGKDIYF